MTEFAGIKCRLCGDDAMKASGRGAYLRRVNPLGETPMVVECAPSCDRAHGTQEDALLRAIEGESP